MSVRADDTLTDILSGHEDPHRIPARTVIALGLGGFATLGGAFWLLVCGMLAVNGGQRLKFAAQSEPLSLTPATLSRARHNDFVTLNARLDAEHRLAVRTVGGRDYTLTPVAGTGGRCVVYQDGGSPGTGDAADSPPLAGRLVGGDWTGEWDLDGQPVDVRALFAAKGIPIDAQAVVLIAGDVPRFDAWQVFAGAVGLAVWAWFTLRVVRTVRFLTDRARLAAHLQTLEDSADEHAPTLLDRRLDAA